jgi:hypothetical protein
MRGYVKEEVGQPGASIIDPVTCVLRDRDSGTIVGVLETVLAQLDSGIREWSKGFAAHYQQQTGHSYTGCVEYEAVAGHVAKQLLAQIAPAGQQP